LTFEGCGNLTSVSLPNSLTHIGYLAFANCCNLTSVRISESIWEIGDRAFSGCSNLTDVFCYSKKIPEFDYLSGNANNYLRMFDGAYIEYATLHVPEESLEAYKTTEPWSGFGTIVALTDEEVGIVDVTEEGKTSSFYNLDGKPIGSPQRGVNIIRTKEGKAKKILVK
jgi:hypothetical protein